MVSAPLARMRSETVHRGPHDWPFAMNWRYDFLALGAMAKGLELAWIIHEITTKALSSQRNQNEHIHQFLPTD
ncbi:hypothetical protein E3U44_16455 [Nitrosococcus wardiae]|uniref:Uncharacterized protein n=1 Tax=Nitrosococcus wardiae TaxID=1814290 RepID=A0A4P7C068_9GAMM|nr:hypothetical protein E3U44_16455 [Nitrosococcus wardiae]